MSAIPPTIEVLLRAGRRERPPEGNEARVLDALGVGMAAASAGASGPWALRAWLRWAGLGLLLSATVAVTASLAGGPRGSPLAAAETTGRTAGLAPRVILDVEHAREREDRVAVAPVTLDGHAQAERAEEGHAQAERAEEGHAQAERAAPAKYAQFPQVLLASPGSTSPFSTTPPSGSPDDELPCVRGIKLALERQDSDAALTALERYARAFPRGTFREEAAALRVRALAVAGRFDEARRAADAFDAAYPHSPYGPRTRDLQQGPGKGPR